MNKTTLFIIVISLLIAACSKKEIDSVDRLNEVEKNFASTPLENEEYREIKEVHKNRFKISDDIESAQVTNDKLVEYVQQLEKYVLSKKYIYAKKIKSEMVDLLILFNMVVEKLESREKGKAYLNRVDFFERFKNIYLEGRNSAFFKRDGASLRHLLRLNRSLEEKLNFIKISKGITHEYCNGLEGYYKIILDANDILKGSTVADYYIQVFKYSGERRECQKLKGVDFNVRRTFRNFVNTSMMLLKEQRNSLVKSEFCTILSEMKPYSLDVKKLSQVDPQGTKLVITEFIKCLKSEKGEKSLSSVVGAYVEKNKNSKNKKFIEIENFLSGYLNYLKRMKIEIPKSEGLLFYVVDGLYRGDYNIDVSRLYWNQISEKISEIDKLKYVKNYFSTIFGAQVKKTQLNFNKYLKESYDSERGFSTESYQDIVNRLNNSDDEKWNEIKRKAKILRSFIVSIYDDKYSKKDETNSVNLFYHNLKSELDNVSSNINYVVSMPLTLVLNYYIAKATGRITITIDRFSGFQQHFEIDAGNALAYFFASDGIGAGLRMFSFGDVDFLFDSVQKIHVFEMALRSGIFETISFGVRNEDKENFVVDSNNEILNNEYLFFKSYIRDVLMIYDKTLDDEKKRLTDTLKSSDLDSFKKFCENPLEARMVYMGEGKLYYDLFEGSKEILSRISESYSALEKLLNGGYLDGKKTSRTLINILEKHLVGNINDNKKEVSKKLLMEIRKIFKSYKDKDIAIAVKLKEIDKVVRNGGKDCFVRMKKAERIRKNTLYKMNIDFYKDIHAALLLSESIDKKIDEINFEDSIAVLEAGWDSYRKELNITLNKDTILRVDRVLRKITKIIEKDDKRKNSQIILKTIDKIFKIHNRKDQQFLDVDGVKYEIGYWVDDLVCESCVSTGLKMNSFNRIEKGVYKQGKWDTLMRIRRQLQLGTVNEYAAKFALGMVDKIGSEKREKMINNNHYELAPNVKIDLGNLKTIDTSGRSSYYNKSDTFSLFLKKDGVVKTQIKFVEDGMAQFGGSGQKGEQLVSWNGPSGSTISNIEERMKYLISLYRAQAVDISELKEDNEYISPCDKDLWGEIARTQSNPECKLLKTDVGEVVDYFVNAVRLFDIKKDDDNFEYKLMMMLDVDGYYIDVAKRFLILENDDDISEITYFGRLYERRFVKIYENNLIPEAATLEFVYHYVINELKDSKNIFPLDKSVTNDYRNDLREKIVKHFELANSFKSYVRALEEYHQEKDISLPNIVFMRERDSKNGFKYFKFEQGELKDVEWVGVLVEDRYLPEYLSSSSDSLSSWFKGAEIEYYVEKAKCKTIPQNGDPDYEKLNKATKEKIERADSCKEKYEVWNENKKEYFNKIKDNFLKEMSEANEALL